MAGLLDLIKGLNGGIQQGIDTVVQAPKKITQAVSSPQGKQVLANLARISLEKKKKEEEDKARVQSLINSQMQANNVQGQTISVPSSAPLDVVQSGLASLQTRFDPIQQLTKNIGDGYNAVRDPIVNAATQGIMSLNPINNLLARLKVNNPMESMTKGAVSGALTKTFEDPIKNFSDSILLARNKFQTGNKNFGDYANATIGTAADTAGLAMSAMPLVAQYNAGVGALQGNERTKSLGDAINTVGSLPSQGLEALVSNLPVSDEVKKVLVMGGNLGLLKAGGKVGEGISKRIDAGNLGRAAGVVGKELTGNKSTMFSGIDPTPFLKGVKEFAKNPIVQSLDPTGITTGLGAKNIDTKNPIVNEKTGETLNDAIQKLRNNGWEEKAITKYKDAILGKGQVKVKKVSNEKVLDSLNPTGGLLVDYTPQERASLPLGDNITTLDKTSGVAANDIITIYRGAPRSQKSIVPGDFITTNIDLAKSYAGEGHIISKKVKASHVIDDINEPLGDEYIYRPDKKTIKKTIEVASSNTNIADTTNVKKQDALIEEAKTATSEPPIPPKENDFSFNQNEFDAINEKIASAKNDAKNAEDAFYDNNRKPDEKAFTNDDFIEKTLLTEKKGGWLSNMLQPAKNLPQDFQASLANWKREKLLGQNRANTEAYSMKDSLDPIVSKESILSRVMNNETSIGKVGKKFIEFMQNPIKEAAKKLGINFEESKKITDRFGSMFDRLRDEAINRGLDFGYIENYLPQLWKDAPQRVQEVFSKSASSKPFFSKERILEDYNTGIKMGLTPKYSHPAQLLGEYIKKMEESLANKKLVDSLVEQKYIAPTDIANLDDTGKTWKVVEIPGLPSGGFKAPPEIQKVLHNIFGVTEKSDVLQTGANVAGFMQKAKLTGGIGTLNGFTVGQAFKEMALGMAHPIDTIKNIVTGKGTGLTNAFVRGISKDASQKYFIDPVNSSAVKELSSHNIELNSPLDYKTMFQNAFEKNKGTSIKDKLLGGAKYSAQKVLDVVNHSDNDTFQQFMPILQIEFYKKAKERLLKKGMGADEAIKTASEQTKNFYGSVNYDLLGRSKNIQNALSTMFFAPRFREGILNVFNNTAKALTTEFKNKSFAENRRLAAGVAITYGLYNALNYQLNGKPMWENASGWEGDLVVPQDDGTVIRVPFMPSFMTMPRNAFGVAKNLLSGDTKEAMKSASGFMSMPIQMSKQLLANEDYFGNPIYTEQIGTNRKGETNTVLDKFKDQALYAGSGFTNSYLQSIIDYGRGKKTGTQAITAALELPVKYGKQKDKTLEKGFETYINYIGLKNDIERLQKDNKDGSKKGEIDAKIQEMKDQAGELSEQDNLTYQGYRSGKLQPQGSDYDTMIQAKYGTTTVRGEATAAAQPVYDNLLKIKELSKDAQGNKEEIARLFTDTKKAFDALSPYEKKNGLKYLLNKKAKTIDDKKKMMESFKKLFGYDDSQE